MCTRKKTAPCTEKKSPHEVFIINSVWWCMMYCKYSWDKAHNTQFCKHNARSECAKTKGLLSVSYFTSTATKEGQVQAALALLRFRGPFLSPTEKAPCPGNCKCTLLGCKHTSPHKNTQKHSCVQWSHTKSPKHCTDKAKCAHTNTVVTKSSTIRSPWYNGVCEWGQTMELFGIWIEPDDEWLRGWIEGFGLLHTRFWSWQYASIRCLLFGIQANSVMLICMHAGSETAKKL